MPANLPDFMISVEQQIELYERVLEMTRSTLRLLDDDQVEDAMLLNAQKLEIIKYIADNRNSSSDLKDKSRSFFNEYVELNGLLTAKVSDFKSKIDESLRNSRSSGRKVCAYQAISRVGR